MVAYRNGLLTRMVNHQNINRTRCKVSSLIQINSLCPNSITLAQKWLKSGFQQVFDLSATSYAQVGDKQSLKLVAALLNLPVWKHDK